MSKDGVFQFAILTDCGNPVKAKPKKPAYNLTKEVAKKGTGKFQHNVTVMSGDHVEYRITVKVAVMWRPKTSMSATICRTTSAT